MSLKAAVALLAALASGALAAPVAAQLPKPMKESEIKAAGGRQIPVADLRPMLVGNTVYVILLRNVGSTAAGTVVPVHNRDHRTRIQWLPDRKKLESNWWFEADNTCVEQRNMNLGHQCYSAWNLAGTQYFCLLPGGDCFTIFRVVPGNPEAL